jgi:hypothetical protein
LALIAEWIITILTLVISIVFFISTFSFPTMAADPGGPSFFPRVVSVITCIGAMTLLVRLITMRGFYGKLITSIRSYLAVWEQGERTDSSDLIRLTTYVLILSAVYPFLIVRVGFILATIAYIFIIMSLLKTKIYVSISYSCILAISLYYAFAKILGVVVYRGVWVEKILGLN